jgi:hypothetical protein
MLRENKNAVIQGRKAQCCVLLVDEHRPDKEVMG